MGIFESEPSAAGTREIWRAVADSAAFSVLGGGDSITAAAAFGVTDDLGYVCTCLLYTSRPALRERLRRHASSRLPSVAKRANRLLERLG